jgi:hypothetical protein
VISWSGGGWKPLDQRFSFGSSGKGSSVRFALNSPMNRKSGVALEMSTSHVPSGRLGGISMLVAATAKAEKKRKMNLRIILHAVIDKGHILDAMKLKSSCAMLDGVECWNRDYCNED